MKKTALLFLLSITFLSCKKSLNKESKKEITKKVVKENFPEELGKVFTAHGGINAWRKAQILSFNKGEEVHTIDLHSRKTVINTPKYSLGFDGKEVWLSQEDSTSFKGNKDIYYNLYFYFYAMPFVLADDGIKYDKVEDLIFESINYSGYKISYNADKGASPDDNYIIYFNPKTYQMEWLAYTFTYGSNKPNDKYSIIKYNKWENVNGLVLPKELTWYKKDEKGMPSVPRGSATEFTLPLVSQAKLADSFFAKPAK